MILTMAEARAALRVDGEHNDDFITPLLDAIPSYLLEATGYEWESHMEVHPLAKTTAQFILQLWFDPQTQDSERLKRTIDSLLTALEAVGRQNDAE